ncbi:MAG: AMP-binding protein [Bacteroidales bacterium]|jgi:phenylacetate-CoA ligase|nr:AMP-binding protein [Bacteroidales bacterium]MEE3406414.1 AMP-binding protein [Candidatus Cryptobacteroides sp.]MBO7365562.1 AMP-binding protein [Bacteroidales bacterium]MBO7623128.1 AMP-binding protein [Bacteroidales bacterium]MBP5234668.1 AMP-binding protein [Bacteroidales bacterium]
MDIEFKSPEEIKKFQEQLLRGALDYLATHSRYYQRVFKDNGIDVSEINTIEDLQKIPFTEKKDLQLFNEDFLCCPKADIVDYVTTSGTLGDPVTFGCTEKDLQRLAYNEKKSFACAGVKHGDIVQLMTTMDKRFMAGLAYFLGIRELGASIIRVGNGIPELQWDTIRRLKPDTIMCVPSFILKLVQYAEEHGIDYRNSSIKRIIGIGEGLREQDFSLNLLGRRIKEKWDVDLFATYSSTEMGATFSECEYGCGGHVHPELIIVEIIGEDNLPVPDGQAGEIVVTTLGVEGMPLLRFRTGDIAAKIVDKCKCGRYSYRLTPLVGRKNNMIKLKGTTLYPPAVNDVLDNTDYVENYVVEVRDSDAGTDEVIVKIGLKSTPAFDPIKDLKDRFRSRIRVAPIIEILPVKDVAAINFPAKSRKPVKFIDNRKKNV